MLRRIVTTPTPPTDPTDPAVPVVDPTASGSPVSRPSGSGWLVAPVIALIPVAVVVLIMLLADEFYSPLFDYASPLGVRWIVPFLAVFVGAVALVTVLALKLRNPWIARIVAFLWVGVGLYLAIILPAVVLITAAMGESGLDAP